MSRSIAVAAYLAALAAPASANWQDVATSLFDCLPKTRGVTVEAGAPAWWCDYKLGKTFRLESMDVLFHDGEAVRVTVSSMPGKLPRIAAAARGAIGFWRARNGHNAAVPAFSSLTMAATGQTYDAEAATRLTMADRAVPGTVQGKPMTAERVAWMAREVTRRLAYMNRMRAAVMASTDRFDIEKLRAAVAVQRASVRGGVEDLRRMRAALIAQRGGAVETVQPVVAPVAAPEAVAPVLAVVVPVDADEAQAMWCEAVAGAYAAPVAWEIPGTDPEADGILVQSIPPVSVERMDESMPAEPVLVHLAATASEPAPVLSTGPTLSEMETVADEWEPTAETHPIVALCLSHKARETLWAMVQDGTFPAETGKAAAGAWRLTLEDARALESVGSIRLVGMPRKPYTRRAAAPVVSSPAIHVPAYGGLTISHHAGGAAVYHSPSL